MFFFDWSNYCISTFNFIDKVHKLFAQPTYMISGRIYLFVVNHASGMDAIEKFEYHADTQSLEHLHSYMDEAINM